MKEKFKKIITSPVTWQYIGILAVLMIFLVPDIAFGAGEDEIKQKFKKLIDAVTNILLYLAPSVAIAVFAWLGIKMYVASNPSEKAEHKSSMLNVLVITAVIFVGALIVNFVVSAVA
ncbi:hypothetical protein BK704_12430 [[Bacillus thuringiensis] serovar konkukian]|nr:TrbC/VirB2 family protein [Bacillus thuringiensis]MED1305200.1 TrbC/VirB2 family protein [Bacillus pacificus]OUB09011.1 hypothetical protein BK704_12430 [[Bacillus thuringiensis] serovar konkukian]